MSRQLEFAFEAYGRLSAFAHLASYSFTKACGELELLIAGNEWKLGGRFLKIDDFLQSLKLGELKSTTEQRKRIALRIKELQPKATVRAIAKAVGAGKTQIAEDVRNRTNKTTETSKTSGDPVRNRTGQIGGSEAAKIVARHEKQGDKKERRDEREQELAAKIIALPDKRYGVIYADPEWRFEPWSRMTGMDRAADNHYPTSSIEIIAARDIPSIAASDCVLFLWATQPMERHAHYVMERWGFNYRSQIIWVKIRPGEGRGTGYWFINEHEVLLVGVRGDIPAPAPGTQWRSVLDAPIGEHSAKPEQFLEMIEQYFPNVPKIELNRRGPPRPGWDAWGNEFKAAAE